MGACASSTRPRSKPVTAGVEFLATRGIDPLVAYEAAVRVCFGSIAALEMQGKRHERVALPLLGGSRGYEPRKAMETILAAASGTIARIWAQLTAKGLGGDELVLSSGTGTVMRGR